MEDLVNRILSALGSEPLPRWRKWAEMRPLPGRSLATADAVMEAMKAANEAAEKTAAAYLEKDADKYRAALIRSAVLRAAFCAAVAAYSGSLDGVDRAVSVMDEERSLAEMENEYLLF